MTAKNDELVKSQLSRQAREERKVKTLKLLCFSWRPLRLCERQMTSYGAILFRLYVSLALSFDL
jgi:hypothetical protein